ncbi:MAG: hypothetical protein ACI9DC_002741 [Gammaproteobacteria bacterium]
MNRAPLGTPVPWRGNELSANGNWQQELTTADVGEIDAALVAAQSVCVSELSSQTFPLPRLAGLLRKVAMELADGRGVAKLSGLPVERYSDAQLRTLYLGLGSHLGAPIDQNGARGLLRDIRDRSAAGGRRVDSAGGLNWHNDRTDIVGLLCVCAAAAGGVSRLCSMTAIHNAMLERCPELLDVLFEDFNRFTPGDEVGGTQGCHALPVLRMDGKRLSTHFSRTYIEQATKLPGAAPLSPQQNAALDMVVSLADEFAFEMTLEAGDIQFLNNHAILHSRSAFTDEPDRGAQRRLLRIWLSTSTRGSWRA